MLKILIIFIFVVVVGGAVFLANWDIPAPLQSIEKVLPDDRFSR